MGVVQGLTEFLPVSSTAHLALVQHFLPGFTQPGILFDVMLHVGTLAAVVVFLRRRLGSVLRGLTGPESPERTFSFRLGLFLLVSVVATGAIAMPLKRIAVEGMSEFRRMGFALCGTAVLLTAANRVGRLRGESGRDLGEMRLVDATAIGSCQALSAVFHGLSRSGNTIAVGLFSGLSRRAAAEFSFLLSIPTIAAAAVVENVSAYRHDPAQLAAFDPASVGPYLLGTAVAAVVGYFAVQLLVRLVGSMKLLPFAAYCAALGVLLIVAPPG